LSVNGSPFPVAVCEDIGENGFLRFASLAGRHHDSIHDAGVTVDPDFQILKMPGWAGLGERVSAHVTELLSLGYKIEGQHVHEVISKDAFQH
jgi:hypothetical protein